MKEQNFTIQLPKLNLPDFEPRLSEKEGKFWVFDSLRKKDLVLTPEEWVRQHWANYLIHHLNYPKGLFSMEKGLKYNQLQKRTDLVVWDQEGMPYLLIECKAPNISINQKTLEQACLYHQKLKAKFLILSNGLKHVCLKWSHEENRFLQEKKFPLSPI
ncbi:type I restriction enzyme HsdR N-terminal domain-containing protein [Algoriphagus sp. CAU 1675]|uniref:type I restriction enzyme HsdR N-terminal domain-containing protein n=1 Tax=Algoriphagus sp. CAU 1675 TaxID=3032597 RepID=UPI0023DBFB08|nr:type I restriction enzyme HsdR N-terminal domain-containing protein [Algoriphagus sp. CAU 1675]MDF2158444.1 type I restriction enzyme HsdR N-terminal domain-containing protein [Algoriphagus sp. CAU 1675]